VVNHVFDKSDAKGSSLQLASLLFPDHDHVHQHGADLDVKALSQGTTNGLFKVSYRMPDSPVDAAALVKVYGDGTEVTIDRNKELKVHALLSENQLSSSPLVRFANGHAYQFITGAVCSVRDMAKPRIYRGVARELARWHATLPSAHFQDPQQSLEFEPSIWSTARRWLDAISSYPGGSPADKERLREQFQYLANRLLLNGYVPDPLVLGHGDLLSGNIIIQASPSPAAGGTAASTDVASVRFIDYEHATFCPRAFELANHFAEWAGFDCDYSLLPTTSTRRDFVREYLRALSDINRQQQNDNDDDTSTSSSGADDVPRSADLPPVTEAEVDRLMDQVDAYRGFPGFYCPDGGWVAGYFLALGLTRLLRGRGLCALIQAETSTGTIDFDYAAYAEKRFAEYRAWRMVDGGSDAANEDMPLREKRWASP
ncbi:ethanolamine kinase, partial [Fusarium albosuccineum]